MAKGREGRAPHILKSQALRGATRPSSQYAGLLGPQFLAQYGFCINYCRSDFPIGKYNEREVNK